jgi:hypothetical protein
MLGEKTKEKKREKKKKRKEKKEEKKEAHTGGLHLHLPVTYRTYTTTTGHHV